MSKIAYRLEPYNEIPTDIYEYLYDIDEDYTSKKRYIERAKKWTDRVNNKFNTNYKWNDLFPEPTDIGWRFCRKCGECYWKDDYCDCE